jgi:peptidoglycan lytic transglycosylase
VVPRSRLAGRMLARASIAIAVAGPGSLGTALASAATTPSGGTAAPLSSDNSHLKVTVTPRQHVLRGDDDPVHGSVRPGRRGRTVLIQVRHDGHGWQTVAHAKTDARGRFRTSWSTRSLGDYELRAKVGSTGPSGKAPHGVTVYKASEASWYGPGFYGNRTACGETLKPSTLGVAHKTLPCGTKVALYYHGHAVTVPVIDRGPYATGREYDLTAETKHRLHFGSTGTVWSAPNPH